MYGTDTVCISESDIERMETKNRKVLKCMLSAPAPVYLCIGVLPASAQRDVQILGLLGQLWVCTVLSTSEKNTYPGSYYKTNIWVRCLIMQIWRSYPSLIPFPQNFQIWSQETGKPQTKYKISRQFCYNLHQKREKLYRDISWAKIYEYMS